jgi:hypothetical protein
MKKCIFLVMMILMSCAKKDLDKPKLQGTLADGGSTPTVYVELNYFASGAQLNVSAYLAGLTSDFTSYSARVKVSGQATAFLSVTSNNISYNTTLSFSSNIEASDITVTVELVKDLSVVSTATQTIRILPLVNSTSLPANALATITLTPQSYNYYYIKASNLDYLANVPGKSVDFYAFYFPTDYQRYTLYMKPVFLGKVNIQGNNFFPIEGSFQFQMPANSYDVSNIRVFITQTSYPLSYFTSRLINIPNEDYLIDWCQYNTFVYTSLNGLDYTNIGRFSSSQLQIQFNVGSMDQMLNTQIYYLKDKGWLW